RDASHRSRNEPVGRAAGTRRRTHDCDARGATRLDMARLRTHPAELERLLHLARAPPATHTDPSTRRSARRGKPHDRLTLRTHRHVARHGCDSSEPVTHVRVRREVELALLATVCVAEEGDVDERRRVADEPVAPIA